MPEGLVLILLATAWLFSGGLVGLALERRHGRQIEQKLAEAEARTRAMLDAAVDGVVTIDERGRVESFNRAAERIFGFTAAEVQGRNVSMLMPEPYRGQHDGYLTNYLTTGIPRIIGSGREVQGMRKDGSVFPMDLAVGESRLGGRRIFAGIVRDITDRKAAEENLRAAKVDAERARAGAEAQRETAERANAAKTKFLAAASHDLRQPVQAIMFFTSVLADKLRGQPAVKVVRDLENSVSGLNMLLDSLLDVSKLDAGMVTPKETSFSVASILDRTRSEFVQAARSKKLRLTVVPSSETVRTDPALLSRIVQNLMSNAVRHTRKGRILLGCRRHGDRLRIEVWDTGPGIPADRTQDIFEEFIQLDNPERDRNQGLGLGLAIVQRLSRLMGHDIGLRSEPGRGSVFWVDVPRIPAQAQDAVPRPHTQGTSRLVVLIDDEAIVLKGLSMVLESWGYRVLAATSEAEAVALLDGSDERPSLILADYRLREGHTGTEAVAHIRDLYKSVIPSIIITGDTAPERLREAERSGLSILHKPIQPPVLREAVRETLALENARLH